MPALSPGFAFNDELNAKTGGSNSAFNNEFNPFGNNDSNLDKVITVLALVSVIFLVIKRR